MPGVNDDPSGDDYNPQYNPTGTENDHRYQMGEPFVDYGLDGVKGTAQQPRQAAGRSAGRRRLRRWRRGRREAHRLERPPRRLLGPRRPRHRPAAWSTPPRSPAAPLDEHRAVTPRPAGPTAACATSSTSTSTPSTSSAPGPRAAAPLTYLSRWFTDAPGLDPNQPTYYYDPQARRLRRPARRRPPALRPHRSHVDRHPGRQRPARGDGERADRAAPVGALLHRIALGRPPSEAARLQVEPSSANPAPQRLDVRDRRDVHGGVHFHLLRRPDGARGHQPAPPATRHKDLQYIRYPVIYILPFHGYGQSPTDSLEAAIALLNNWWNSAAEQQGSSRLPSKATSSSTSTRAGAAPTRTAPRSACGAPSSPTARGRAVPRTRAGGSS